MVDPDQFRNQWNQIRGKLKEKWGKLTEDDIMQINGRLDQMISKLQARYGFERGKAEEEFSRFVKSLSMTEGAPRATQKTAGSGTGYGSNPGSRPSSQNRR